MFLKICNYKYFYSFCFFTYLKKDKIKLNFYKNINLNKNILYFFFFFIKKSFFFWKNINYDIKLYLYYNIFYVNPCDYFE